MKLGASLSFYCKRKGLTLAEVARRSGVPKQTLHGWSTGRENVNLTQLRSVAKILSVSVHELAFGERDPFESPSNEILQELFSGDVRVTLHKIDRRRS